MRLTKMISNKAPSVVAAFLLFAGSAAVAQVQIDKAWVRTTVAQQKASGVYMVITAARGGKLVEASSPIASAVEVHEMKMDGDTMRMRHVPALALPAGQAVELKPGGYHLMLLGLKGALKAGDAVPLALVVEDASGKRETVEVTAMAKNPTARTSAVEK